MNNPGSTEAEAQAAMEAAIAAAQEQAQAEAQAQEQAQAQANTTEQEGEDAPAGPSGTEGFSNLRWNGIQLDLVLKAIFFGCLFYLLSQPELYKITKKCCKKVDGVLLHAIVFAVLYFIVIHFI